MSKKYRSALLVLFLIAFVGLVAFLLNGDGVVVLNPKGTIAQQQRNLMITALLLMSIVVIPVFVLTFTIALKYREGNKSAKYTPDWDHSKLYESIWWGLPCAIILVLGVITWKSSHQLDPFKPLDSSVKPIKVQVIALQWKWLFIYPEQNIASINFVQFPEDTPVNFEITADAPMNSFWIPQLGGQIYAMAGMSTELHLMADDPGSYRGSSANISGTGFAGMDFIAKASSTADFEAWVESVRKSPHNLSYEAYNTLAVPSEDSPEAFYASSDLALYDKVLMKYMAPMSGSSINDNHPSISDEAEGHN